VIPTPRWKKMTKDRRTKDEFDLRKVLTGRGPGQSRLKLAPEHVIYAQGDAADALFYVESGWVKMSAVVPSGKEPVIAIRRGDEFFGVRSMVAARRQATATALTDCSLVRVTRSALNRLLREQPDFAVTFAAYLVRRSIFDQESLIDHLTSSAEKRLARTLLQLASEVGVDDAPFIPARRVNQALLANMIGTTRSRVSVFLSKFKRQGLITYDRHGHMSVRKPALGGWLER
jgi:CRP/FNR family transcriptional regulator, cyclic AMP receptor protein